MNNKELPNGWGNNDEDEDYGFADYDEEEYSAWGNNSEPIAPNNENKTQSIYDKSNTDSLNTAPVNIPETMKKSRRTAIPPLPAPNTAPTPKKNHILPVLITILIIILLLAVGILTSMIFSMKSNDNDNIGNPDTVFSVANLAEAPEEEEEEEEEEEDSQPPVITTTAPKSSGNVKKENSSAYVAGKKENESASSSAYANAYIELRSGVNKDTSSGMITWYRRPGTNYYLHVTGDFSYYKNLFS